VVSSCSVQSMCGLFEHCYLFMLCSLVLHVLCYSSIILFQNLRYRRRSTELNSVELGRKWAFLSQNMKLTSISAVLGWNSTCVTSAAWSFAVDPCVADDGPPQTVTCYTALQQGFANRQCEDAWPHKHIQA
jgi:hypothetical protein